jgi:ribonuclease BN (tRNA processing enzyme)
VEFAAGSRLLVHEAWHAQASTDDETHSAAGEAGSIARRAEVERLVLIHLHPLLASDEELLEPARAEFPASSAGQDLVPLA